jgi:hypothetical protein
MDGLTVVFDTFSNMCLQIVGIYVVVKILRGLLKTSGIVS